MRISVIIPAYNVEKFLAQALESVRAQTVTDWEAIVVDDGSTDGTADIARRFAEQDPRIRCAGRPNGGIAAARNTGMERADPGSRFFAFPDADDLLEPDALETLQGALETAPEAAGAYGLTQYMDSEGRPFRVGEAERYTRNRRGIQGNRRVAWPADRPTTFATLVCWNAFMVGAALLRREAVEAAGPFDANLRMMEDWDMWLRLTRHGDLVFVDRLVYRYRQHGSNISRDEQKMREALLYVRRKLLQDPELSAEQRAMVRQGWRYAERDVCALRLRWAWHCLRRGQLLGATKQARHALRGYARFLRGTTDGLEAGG